MIRDAATVILARGDAVLMGKRGAKAAFMPSKYVFPGGAVDAGDARVPMLGLPPSEASRLSEHADPALARALPAAAIREVWEETGQRLSAPGRWDDAPDAWRGFADGGHVPDASPLSFVFRAITPPGRTRRYDARFFLADAAALTGDPDDFEGADEELSDLAWVPLGETRRLDLPFITELVLAEVEAILSGRPQQGVPFVRNEDDGASVVRLGG